MTSRERILKTLDLKEPDRVPFDLGSTGKYRDNNDRL